MTAPSTDFEAPVPSLLLSVTGPTEVIRAPEGNVSPSVRPDTTLSRRVVSGDAEPTVAPSDTSDEKMYGLPLATMATAA